VAERHGWNMVSVFEDAGISGAKGRDHRSSEAAAAGDQDRAAAGATRQTLKASLSVSLWSWSPLASMIKITQFKLACGTMRPRHGPTFVGMLVLPVRLS
jgi:hypothetical protein